MSMVEKSPGIATFYTLMKRLQSSFQKRTGRVSLASFESHPHGLSNRRERVLRKSGTISQMQKGRLKILINPFVTTGRLESYAIGF